MPAISFVKARKRLVSEKYIEFRLCKLFVFFQVCGLGDVMALIEINTIVLLEQAAWGELVCNAKKGPLARIWKGLFTSRGVHSSFFSPCPLAKQGDVVKVPQFSRIRIRIRPPLAIRAVIGRFG